jgi:hypothetical protein
MRIQGAAWLQCMHLSKVGVAFVSIGARSIIHYLSRCRKTALVTSVNYKKWRKKMRFAHMAFEVTAIGVMVLAFISLAVAG